MGWLYELHCFFPLPHHRQTYRLQCSQLPWSNSGADCSRTTGHCWGNEHDFFFRFPLRDVPGHKFDWLSSRLQFSSYTITNICKHWFKQYNKKVYCWTVFTQLTPVLVLFLALLQDGYRAVSFRKGAQSVLLHAIGLLKMWYWIWHYNGQLYSTNDMVQWTICLGNKRTADIRSAVRGDTHTHIHGDTCVRRYTQNHTQAQRVPWSALQDWKPFFCVCFSVQCTNKWIQSLGELFVCLKGLCPCCDIIYECHNWGSVNCRFSPLSDAPCVNTEVQGDGVDQYAETGAIPWIYSPVTRELWNNTAVAFSQLLDETAALPARICQTCAAVILQGILCHCCCFRRFLCFWVFHQSQLWVAFWLWKSEKKWKSFHLDEY